MSGIIVGMLSSMISLAVIFLVAAEGEVFVEQSGQFNMGIEGIMISSALAAFAGTYFSKSVFVGFMAGAVTGAVLGYFIFFFIEKLNINGVLVAVIFNLLSSGITGFLAVKCLNNGNVPLQCKKMTVVAILGLSKIPYLGEILFKQNLVVYLAVLAVPLLSYYLFHTKSGLEIRAVGEDAMAAQTMGINVSLIKMKCFVYGGIGAGIAGAYVSLTMGLFMDGMTENKGFIAMALCAFSRRNPIGTLLGALFFSLVDAIQIYLQLFDSSIPYEFMVSLPYILTIVALLFTSDKLKRRKTKKKVPRKARKTAETDPEYMI